LTVSIDDRQSLDPTDLMEVEEVLLRPDNVTDIDLADEEDPCSCATFVNDIYNNLRRNEVSFRYYNIEIVLEILLLEPKEP
jgi:hypothetical protein